ncbi:MAG: peroxidase family protein [Novosphingobium sp.]|nr:peroxidase family protein [Novosphingobium sp.]
MYKHITFLVIVLSFICSYQCNNCLKYILHRSIDGSCNNVLFNDRGKGNELFITGEEGSDVYPSMYIPKVTPLPTYAEMESLPDDDKNGNPRRISNLLGSSYDENIIDARNKTMFEVFFAQFVGHDLNNHRFENPGDAGFQGDFVSYIKDTDDIFCTYNGDYRCNDNDTVLTTNGQRTDGIFNPDGTFRGINNASAYLDLNTLYGVNEEVAGKLRTNSGGKLVMNKERTFNITLLNGETFEYTLKNFLPIYDDLPLPLDRLFTILGGTNLAVVGGDHRLNVNLGVAFFHTLFSREHNKICDELMDKNFLWKLLPSIFDDLIYQKARHILIAKYQKIIYEQHLPSLLGAQKYNQLGHYDGYKILTDPSISTSFSSSAFRYGHYIMKDFHSIDECNVVWKYGKPSNDTSHRPINAGGTNPIPDGLTHIGRVVEFGSYENYIRGIISQVHMAMNFTMHPVFRNLDNVRGGFDLTALDIMRSRFNTVPSYLKLRRTYYNLGNALRKDIYGNNDCPSHLENEEDIDDPLDCFLYVTSNIDTATKLKEAYGKVIYIDGHVGMMIEEHDDTTSIGETAANIIIDQFRRIRNGDRFYYEKLLEDNYFSRWEEEEISETTMGKLLRRNFDGDEDDFPDNPFILPEDYRLTLEERCI